MQFIHKIFGPSLSAVAVAAFALSCGGETGGGGTSVGTALTSTISLALSAKDAPAAAPQYVPELAQAAGAVPDSVTRAVAGIHQIKIEVGKNCDNTDEFQWEGSYQLSLTENTITPSVPPIEVPADSLVCRLKIEWDAEDQNGKEQPSLEIDGSLDDGRNFHLRSFDVDEFEIKSAQGIAVDSDAITLTIVFPYEQWLDDMQYFDLEGQTEVLISDKSNEGVLEYIQDKFEQESDVRSDLDDDEEDDEKDDEEIND